MNLLYQWISSILCFLIFITMTVALLPTKKYEKYIRFFGGIVLILLVLRPLTGSLGLEDKIAYYFETITFQKESQDLSREILGIETKRLKQVMAEYEKAVEQEVSLMAEDVGFFAETVKAVIESDRSQADYGAVTHISMVLVKEENHGIWENGMGETENSQEKIVIGEIEIEPIYVGTEDREESGLIQGAGEEAGSKSSGSDKEIAQLRRKVERYYGLESHEVEIKLKVRQE